MSSRRESAQRRRLVALLRAAGCEVLVAHGHGQQAPGWPDVVAACPGGLTLWVELKAGAGRVSARQAERVRALRRLGHAACVLRDLAVIEGPDGEEEVRVCVVGVVSELLEWAGRKSEGGAARRARSISF